MSESKWWQKDVTWKGGVLMSKEIRGLSSIKTFRKVKHRSMSKWEGTDDAELYLLKNNLILAKKENVAVDKRRGVIGRRIKEIEERIRELEVKAKKRPRKKRAAPTVKKSSMQVVRIDY